ncbi:MAG: hypothetical protein IKK75_12105 [Clostridia bacterium]|nr:hypothetical protein [Clostridia bacterium]
MPTATTATATSSAKNAQRIEILEDIGEKLISYVCSGDGIVWYTVSKNPERHQVRVSEKAEARNSLRAQNAVRNGLKTTKVVGTAVAVGAMIVSSVISSSLGKGIMAKSVHTSLGIN